MTRFPCSTPCWPTRPSDWHFVDRNGRFVRVNQVFADLTGAAVSRHLGRTLPDLLPQAVATEMEGAVQRVFSSEEPVRNLELNGEGGRPRRPWTWLISAYPVRTTPNQVRWVGIIALDASDRKRSEEALRRSEKLAVTGRLAASIAHEINNPLEAITNLLFLLRNSSDLPDAAKQYVTMAEHEVHRIAEITQQTLRFYRQPTQPARATLAELLDSVLNLYQSRIHALDLHVERDYDAGAALSSALPERSARSSPTWWAIPLTPAATAAGWWCARGARATGRIPRKQASGLPWPTPARAWSRRCASTSSRPSSPPRK